MTSIELPRALEDYFAFAETEPTRRGRRFSISLPYFDGDRIERLQWWYHVTAAQEQMYEGTGLVVFRSKAMDRFRRHIEQWLSNTRQRLHGEEPIPRLSRRKTDVSALEIAAANEASADSGAARALAEVIPLPVERVANG